MVIKIFSSQVLITENLETKNIKKDKTTVIFNEKERLNVNIKDRPKAGMKKTDLVNKKDTVKKLI